MAEIRELVTKDAIEIRDDVLRTIKNGLIEQGVENPYVGPNSDWFIVATSLGNELAVVQANAITQGEMLMLDTAIEEGLARWAKIFDREKQPASGSIGSVIVESSADTTIETGRELTDDAGQRFEVTIGGSYSDGDLVPVAAIDVGFSTNHAAGDVLRWASAPPFCSNDVIVATGGLTNAIDAEDDEVLRGRLYALLRTPAGAGNWEHVAEIAEESSPSVSKAFVYPAVQGPSTMHYVVTAAPTTSNKSRVVSAVTLSGVIDPYVKGKYPTRAYILGTTVSDLPADVAIGLSIPDAPTANPPGPGGGWLNPIPWPTVDISDTTTYRCAVTSVTSDTVFTVDAKTVPTVNVTRIAWLSPNDWILRTALVTAFSGSSGAYTITIDSPFASIAADDLVWPECENAQTYVDAALAHFALMGPGEKTSNASALARGFRHPPPSLGEWPYRIDPKMLGAVSDSGDEVEDALFLYRTAAGAGTVYGAGGSLTPPVPASVTDPTNIFIPRRLAFYRIPS